MASAYVPSSAAASRAAVPCGSSVPLARPFTTTTTRPVRARSPVPGGAPGRPAPNRATAATANPAVTRRAATSATRAAVSPDSANDSEKP
jgi:hypothetical protein